MIRRTPCKARLFIGVVAFCFAFAVFTATELSAQATITVLTNVSQIRALTPEKSAQELPVNLLGVVIDDADPPEHAAFLADSTGGIYLLANTNLFTPFQRGDLLEITGVTDPGEFAPIVKATMAIKVGRKTIPAARAVTYQELITGALDAQWVELTGVVRRNVTQASETNIWRILLAANGGVVSVRGITRQDPRMQVDAEVSVQAVCLYQFNQKRQVLTPVLSVPSGVQVRVVKPAPANPFDAPVRSANSLLQFAPNLPKRHRVHVRGVVTYAQSGSRVWIRDLSSGLRIQTAQREDLEPGDQIDVLGFPTYGSSSPMLEEAIFRRTGSTNPPTPLFLTSIVAAFDYEDDLIETTATLKEVQPVLEGLVLTFEQDGTEFKGIFKQPIGEHTLPDWQADSQVQVVGICRVIHDEARPMMGIWQPQSFQMLLRSPADLTVIKPPSWWTPRHLISVLGTASAGLLLAMGVITFVSRHHLKEQARNRAMAEAEFVAIFEERNRMAREIHDTLAQGMAATSVQLRLAKKMVATNTDSLTHHLDLAQHFVRESLEEARNSIWNMRSQVLETGDLPNALKGILQQLADGSELQTRCEVTGQARRLSAMIENNLLRLGQEAITNAIHHSQARQVNVILEFGERQLRLTVRDDGCGFEVVQPPNDTGGFGLVGMQERAVELKGELTIHSVAGKGTDVILVVPLSSE